MADTDFTLFYFPASYYSLKALYVLHEKGVPFKEHIVHIHFGDQHEDWYRRMNSNGKVPVLKDGDKIVCESEEIINYVDKRCPSENPLVPDLGTKLGQEVDRFRKLLDNIEIEPITYGVFSHRSLAKPSTESALRMAQMFTKHNAEKRLADGVKTLQKRLNAASSEEERRYCEFKMREAEIRHAVITDINKVSKLLDEQESLFDELEAQLTRVKRDCKSGDYWLCGSSFTAADITASTLVMRFCLLGIEGRYFISKRPLLCEYKDRLMARLPYKKMEEASNSTPRHIRNKLLKVGAKRALKVGLVIGAIGACVYIYRKYLR